MKYFKKGQDMKELCHRHTRSGKGVARRCEKTIETGMRRQGKKACQAD